MCEQNFFLLLIIKNNKRSWHPSKKILIKAVLLLRYKEARISSGGSKYRLRSADFYHLAMQKKVGGEL